MQGIVRALPHNSSDKDHCSFGKLKKSGNYLKHRDELDEFSVYFSK